MESRAEALFLLVAGIAIVGLFWTMVPNNSTGNFTQGKAYYLFNYSEEDMQQRSIDYKLCRQACYSDKDSRFSPDRQEVRDCLMECAKIANAPDTYRGFDIFYTR